MSLRYGDKTRVGLAASKAGRNDPAPVAGLNVYEQEFLAPGTWTWPGNCNFVEVLVVGGGGSGRTTAPPYTQNLYDAAGGGGVGTFTVPVSAPVPVTVGGGGSSPGFPTPLPLSPGTQGGTSAFGPLSPPVPSLTARVGGGMGGDQSSAPFDPIVPDAIRGGGHSGANYAFGGRYGTVGNSQNTPAGRQWGGGGGKQGAFVVWPDAYAVGFGTYGYGAGGYNNAATDSGVTAAGTNASYVSPILGVPRTANAGRANTGAAGGMGAYPPTAPYPAPLMVGAAGGSGIVIVRWYE